MAHSEKGNYIGDFYSLHAERIFLNRQLNQGLTLQQAQTYLFNQQTHFLEEFVGKVPRQEYRYTFDQREGMKPIGMTRPAAAEYWDLAEKSGVNSREWADAVGFSLIDEAFLTNTANVAYWVSPPSIGQKGFGDYGFFFVFKKDDDNQVRVKIHRYEKESATLSQSNIIMQFLSAKHALNGIDATGNPLQFLQHPLLINGVNDDQISQDIAELANSKQVNFASDKIAVQKTRQFQEKIINYPLIQSWMSDYAQDMMIAADDQVNFVNQKVAMQRAEKTRIAIYNLAQALNEGLNRSEKDRALPQQIMDIQYSVADLRHYYSNQKSAVVFGGGSCPVSDSNGSDDNVDSLLNRGILNYKSASEISKKWDYHDGDCVHCKAKNTKVGPCNICQVCEKLPELNK